MQNEKNTTPRSSLVDALFEKFRPLLDAFSRCDAPEEEELAPCGRGPLTGALRLKKLNEEEIIHIHRRHLKRDFPPAEVKPLTAILPRVKNGTYVCYGAYDGQGLAAYLFVSAPTDNPICLLDYLAVCEGRRGQGIGSLALPMLQDEMRDTPLLIEVEDPADTDVPSEKELRKRRIAFYERLGCQYTGIRAFVYGVIFRIYVLGGDVSAREGLRANYENLFDPEFRVRHVKILD